MVIHVRDPRLWAGNPNVEHWANARAILNELGSKVRTSDIEIDRMSGTLVIRVYDVYPVKEAA